MCVKLFICMICVYYLEKSIFVGNPLIFFSEQIILKLKFLSSKTAIIIIEKL